MGEKGRVLHLISISLIILGFLPLLGGKQGISALLATAVISVSGKVVIDFAPSAWWLEVEDEIIWLSYVLPDELFLLQNPGWMDATIAWSRMECACIVCDNPVFS